MERYCFRYVVVLAIVISVDILSQAAAGRYLRPSDHGLAYQDSSAPTRKKDALSFFGRSPPPPVELPEARNVTGGAWWKVDSGGGVEAARDGKKDRVMKEMLLAGSLVCGITGVVLLAVAAFLVVSRLRKQTTETTSSASTLVPNDVVHK